MDNQVVEETQGEFIPQNPNLYLEGDDWLDWWLFECGRNSGPSIPEKSPEIP